MFRTRITSPVHSRTHHRKQRHLENSRGGEEACKENFSFPWHSCQKPSLRFQQRCVLCSLLEAEGRKQWRILSPFQRRKGNRVVGPCVSCWAVGRSRICSPFPSSALCSKTCNSQVFPSLFVFSLSTEMLRRGITPCTPCSPLRAALTCSTWCPAPLAYAERARCGLWQEKKQPHWKVTTSGR